MQTHAPTLDDLRRLSGLRSPDGQILSLYLNLDPAQWGTAPARDAAIASLVTTAEREIEDEAAGRSHEQRLALRGDLARARAFFATDGYADRAHGIALFASHGGTELEALKLGRPVASQAVVGEAAHVVPLAELVARDDWCVVLTTRRDARLLRGDAERLVEIRAIESDVRGQHQQGGWSQKRYERTIENEADAHLQQVADALAAEHRRRRIDRLAIGATEENAAALAAKLGEELHEQLAGRIDVDAERATPDEVLERLAPLAAGICIERERTALERLGQGLADGLAVSDWPAVLRALHERRVATLLLAGGAVREDLANAGIEHAVEQSADVLVLRSEPLETRDGVAALLRF